jgi:hypothetical protein
MKKSISLFAVCMLAMLMVGISYSMWSRTLYINGTVYTGILNWEFTSCSALDTDPGTHDYHSNDGFAGWSFWQGDKDVGNTSVAIVDPPTNHTVNVTLNNVYPSYFTSVSVYALNTGTVPLIFANVTVDGHVFGNIPTPRIQLDLDHDGTNDTDFWWGDGIRSQIDVGYPSGELSFWIHILEGAHQNATLSFTIQLTAVNYNEYVPQP